MTSDGTRGSTASTNGVSGWCRGVVGFTPSCNVAADVVFKVGGRYDVVEVVD
jgi:hypothetical protein